MTIFVRTPAWKTASSLHGADVHILSLEAGHRNIMMDIEDLDPFYLTVF